MSGVKGRSGRRPFEIEYTREKLKDSTITKAWRIVESKLSSDPPDKLAIGIASSIALRDLGNDKKSEFTVDNRQIHLTSVELPVLRDSVDRLKLLAGVVKIDSSSYNNAADDI